MYNKLEGVKEAIKVYHMALDNRKHGGVAQDKCIKSIESILNMPWSASNKPLKSENHTHPECSICSGKHFDFECPDRE